MSQTRVPAEVREQVRTRAGGRCEYCRIPEAYSFSAHQVDHVIAQKHGGSNIPDNLAFCCVACNQFKGTDLASIDPLHGGRTVLFHPRQHRWPDHFKLRGAHIDGLTPIGRSTARLLRFNDPERLAEREWLVRAGVLTL